MLQCGVDRLGQKETWLQSQGMGLSHGQTTQRLLIIQIPRLLILLSTQPWYTAQPGFLPLYSKDSLSTVSYSLLRP